MAQQSIVYGRRRGADTLRFLFPVGASEVFKQAGGSFVKTDGSGRVELAVAGETEIIGAVLLNADETASSTEGASKYVVDLSTESVYEIPIDTTSTAYAATMLGKAVDLIVNSNVQEVDLANSGEGVLQIVGEGSKNAAGTVISVLVRIVAGKVVLRGV